MSELRSQHSHAKALDVVQVRFRLPDLEQQQRFLADFGAAAEIAQGVLLGRASSGDVVYRAEQGDPAFDGLVFAVRQGDLELLSEHGEVGDFGFGQAVRLTDPDGWSVHAIERRSVDEPVKGAPRNEAGNCDRARLRYRVSPGPSNVRRLGHVVLRAANFQASLEWYQQHFGFLISDAVSFDGQNDAAAFLRCDKSNALTDHHTLFLMQAPDGKAAFEHAAFEVRDFDDLMVGHAHLKAKDYEHSWGVGRHILGAHIFDYWRDPFGFELEHWTDGDLIDASDPPARHGPPELLGTQWGPPHPMVQGGAR